MSKKLRKHRQQRSLYHANEDKKKAVMKANPFKVKIKSKNHLFEVKNRIQQ